jgi:predicted Zn-dependent peptidase
MYKRRALKNGLKMAALRMGSRDSLSLGIWINAGGRYESTKEKGVSHFIEHLLFKGSKHYSCRRIKESIEGVGGSLNAFTSEELTCYLVKIPSRYFKLSLDVLSDMVLHPAFPPAEIEKEKQVILEEIKMYRDLPQSYVYELLDELLWPGQPLGEPIIGTVASVSGMTRQDLSLFKQKFYTPSNMLVSAAGALEYDEFFNAVTRIFSSCEETGRNEFIPVIEEQKEPRFKLFDKDTEQTHLAMGFHAFKRNHPLRHPLAILHVIMGANMSSRLFNEVREKRGLAYEIGTQAKRLHDTGLFLVHAGIDNSKVEDAISLILQELTKIKARLPSKDEFRRAKEFYIGQLMLALEDTMDHMLWIGENASTMDKIYTAQEIIREVKKVELEDVRKAARLIFKEDNLSLALIGPLEDKEKQIYRRLHLA